MVRDFLRQVIELKKTLRQDEERLNIDAAKIAEEILYSQSGADSALVQKAMEIESKQVLVKYKLLRAQLFGMRYARGPDFQCIYCFVDYDFLPQMEELPARVLGTRLAKCNRCSKELIIND